MAIVEPGKGRAARNAGTGGTMLAIGWFGVWTLGGAWVAGALLWHVAGKEIIDLNAMTLKRRKQIPVVGRSKEFAVAGITNLRPVPPVPASLWFAQQQNMWFLGFNDGSISFDYGRDTHHLASDLDEADAKYVIGEMCKRVKSLGS